MIARGEREMRVLSERDPVMALLIARCGALTGGGERLGVYESLVVHIVSRMLSGKVGVLLAQRIRKLAGGISLKKAQSILALTEDVRSGRLDLGAIEGMGDEEAIAFLMQIRGVGRWTAEMIAEFTLGRPEIFSFGDAAPIGGIKRAYGFENRKPPALRSPEEALLAPLQRGLALLLPGQRRCGVEAAALIAGMPARMPVSASRAVP